ncbi:MAG: methionyl-tRNA formyltransferase [Candidatus Coatesbacteria bacterium]
MRVAFFGTPAFALPALHALPRAGFDVCAVVTPPDRPRGRGHDRLEPPPVAASARDLGLRVLQPESPRTPGFREELAGLSPDALVVVAYGHLIPDALVAVAPRGAWNVHPSLLPRWRGPAPVHRTVWAGDPEAGVSIMRLVAKMDAGPVAASERTPVGPHETRGQLEARLAAVGAALLVRVLGQVADGNVTVMEQDEAAATYAGVFAPVERELRWDRPADELDRLVRALAPAPGAWMSVRNERVKVLEALPGFASAAPGTLVERDPQGAWLVACRPGGLWLRRVQPEGKGPMTMDAFVAGRRLNPGDAL